MKSLLFSLTIISLTANAFSQCNSLSIKETSDYLKKESIKDELYFTRVPIDSLEIAFNDNFTNDTIKVEINGTTKLFVGTTIPSLGYTGALRFARPTPKEKIKITIRGGSGEFLYNNKFNMIYVWFGDCCLNIRNTNHAIIYE